MTYTITIYGTNIVLNNKTPAISTLQGLSDLVYANFEVLGIYGTSKIEGEEQTYFNNSIIKRPIVRNTYTIKVAPKPFDSTHLDQLLSENLWSKKYHYLDFGNFPYRVSYCSQTQALWITVDEITKEDKNGLRSITITVKEVMPYGS